MMRFRPVLLLAGAVAAIGLTIGLSSAAPSGPKSKPADMPLEIAKIHWEYNATAQDLGVHVALDGEDWKKIKITNPDGKVLFNGEGPRALQAARPDRAVLRGRGAGPQRVPARGPARLFPEGTYTFAGKTVDNANIGGTSEFTHAIPDGPVVSSTVGPGTAVQISWTAVTSPPPGFPDEPIDVVSYQVLVPETLDIIVPSTVLSLTLPPEYSAALGSGDHPFEVLAIDVSGNQTTSEGTFTLP